jgi:hypothetical protein
MSAKRSARSWRRATPERRRARAALSPSSSSASTARLTTTSRAPKATNQPRPDLVPSLLSTPILDLVPPIGDEDEDEVRPRPSTSSRPVVKKTVPLLGDDGFDEFLIAAVEASQITQAEASERYEFGKLIRAALAS